MPTRNLVPGQYQIGNLILGPWTPFSVDDIDIANYDMNVMDWQVQGSSEMRYGFDTFKPAPIHLKINVRKNRINPAAAAVTNDTRVLNFDNDPVLADLQREWRAPETLQNWNALKPLYFCGTDGITRQFYGRPGKFTYKKHKQVQPFYYQVTAEFRRADTLAYSDTEYFVNFVPGVPQTLPGTAGNAPSWIRMLIWGPANHPIINFGTKQIELNYNILAGSAVEISSLPWERRVIDLNGISLASYIVSDQPYLDQILLPNDVPTIISWNATGTTTASKMQFLWRNGYQVMD